jgi:ethanolamine utilization protein EutN
LKYFKAYGQFKLEVYMLAGKVVGSVVATRKNEKLVGNKFMIVEVIDRMRAKGQQLIAVDNVGAGIGEYVLVAQGSAARVGCDMKDAPVDAAIVGIIDDGTRLE